MKYRRAMPILPLAAAITVLLDGRPVASYEPAYLAAGRAYAPLAPYVTRIADRLEYVGPELVITRGFYSARVRLNRVEPDALDHEYVAIAPVLRALGETVFYDARTRTLRVHTPAPEPAVSPAPFNPREPQQVPRVVFTPSPIPTPRAQWHGPAFPRRTPLPYPVPT